MGVLFRTVGALWGPAGKDQRASLVPELHLHLFSAGWGIHHTRMKWP
jgi:hypothetical protein